MASVRFHSLAFLTVPKITNYEYDEYVGLKGFHQVWYQGGVKATVSGVVEDLKFKISEGSDQYWCFPDSAQLAVTETAN